MSAKVLITVIVLAAILGGGFYISQQKSVTEVAPKTQTTETATADWKTYTNDEFGFQLKYPPSMVVSENPGELASSKWVTVDLKNSDFTLSFFAGTRPTGGPGEGYDNYQSKEVFVSGKQVTESILTSGQGENADFLFSLYTRHANDQFDNFFAHLKNSQLETAVPLIESIVDTLSYR